MIPIKIKINYFLSCRYQSRSRPFFLDGQCQSMVDTKWGQDQLFLDMSIPIEAKINYLSSVNQYQSWARSIISKHLDTYRDQDQLFLNILIPIEIKINYFLTCLFQSRAWSIISWPVNTNQDQDHFFSGWSMSLNGWYQSRSRSIFSRWPIPIESKINYFLMCRYQSRAR